tara:strand:- start:1713 stop:2141 length:429 start_codon:yes stop_codon:yes gene_type:complete
MVEVSQIINYILPILVAFTNGLYLKYKEVDYWTIITSSVLVLVISLSIYFYNCKFAKDPNDDPEIKKLKQENAGLKSNLMKIHREIIPQRNSRQPSKVSFEQPKMPMPMKMPQMAPPKIEEVPPEKTSAIFSEAEDAKPFEI